MTTTMPHEPDCHRGDVVLVLFPHADLRRAKPRPAVVIQADNLDAGLPQVVVAMITSRLFRADHSSRVVVRLASSAGRQSGLLADSVAMTDNLATVELFAISRVIGRLPMHEIDGALHHTLGLT